jgi:hypothetical protein
VELALRMAAVVQCANACSLRTGGAWTATPSGVSSSGSGRDGVQSWTPRGFGAARCKKAGGEHCQGRGVVSMALAQGEEAEEVAAGGVFRFAQKAVVALALGLSLSIGGQFSFPCCLNRSPLSLKYTRRARTHCDQMSATLMLMLVLQLLCS